MEPEANVPEDHQQPVDTTTDGQDAPAAAAATKAVAVEAVAAAPTCAAARRLAPLLEGLQFPSESEYPLLLVELTPDQLPGDAGAGPISAAAVRAAAGATLPAAAPAAARDFGAFWAPLADADPDCLEERVRARFAALRDAMAADLSDLTVLRFDRIEVHVFVLGRCRGDSGGGGGGGDSGSGGGSGGGSSESGSGGGGARPSVVGFRTISVET